MTDSGGGVTLSGGEPLLYPSYTLELLGELGRRGFHRAVYHPSGPPQVVRSVRCAMRCCYRSSFSVRAMISFWSWAVMSLK